MLFAQFSWYIRMIHVMRERLYMYRRRCTIHELKANKDFQFIHNNQTDEKGHFFFRHARVWHRLMKLENLNNIQYLCHWFSISNLFRKTVSKLTITKDEKSFTNNLFFDGDFLSILFHSSSSLTSNCAVQLWFS